MVAAGGNRVGPQRTLQALNAEIQYVIVALCLREQEINSIVENTTGVAVNGTRANFLNILTRPQLEAVTKALSHHPNWQKLRAV
jgi:hypothetical protein